MREKRGAALQHGHAGQFNLFLEQVGWRIGARRAVTPAHDAELVAGLRADARHRPCCLNGVGAPVSRFSFPVPGMEPREAPGACEAPRGGTLAIGPAERALREHAPALREPAAPPDAPRRPCPARPAPKKAAMRIVGAPAEGSAPAPCHDDGVARASSGIEINVL